MHCNLMWLTSLLLLLSFLIFSLIHLLSNFFYMGYYLPIFFGVLQLLRPVTWIFPFLIVQSIAKRLDRLITYILLRKIFVKHFFGLLLLFLQITTWNTFIFLVGASTGHLRTCLYHLKLFSLNLSQIGTPPNIF